VWARLLSRVIPSQFEHGEDWLKSARYYLSAAEKVKAQHAYQQALDFCGRALELTTQAPGFDTERVHALVLRGDLQSLLSDIEQANHSYEQAIETVSEPNQRRVIANRRHQPYTITRAGANVVFYEHGSGDTTLVLGHPVIYGLASFQPLVEKLCQTFRIITIVPRGSGASDPLTGPYSLKEHAEDVRAVIEAASADNPVVCIGVSRGGTLMITLAAAYPKLVHKLVLVSTSSTPSTLFVPSQSGWIEEFRTLLRQGKKEQAIRLAAYTVYSEPGTDHLVEQNVRLIRSIPTDTLLNFFTPDPGDDVVSLLSHIHVPTLVMHGTADRRVPFEDGQYVAAHIPGAQLYPFEGKGHMAMFTTAVNEFCEVLHQFVKTGSVPGSGRATV
jgi:pimeloyl-ACP methyl ester carboxylesterase